MLIRNFVPAVSTLSLLVLAACGGDNGMVGTPGNGEQTGGMQPAVPTLAQQYSAQPDVSYTPITATLERDFSSGTTAVTDALRVSSIQRTVAGGFRIEYHDGEETLSIEFGQEHCVGIDYCSVDSDGRSYEFWSMTSSNPLGGPTEYDYVDALHFTGRTSTGVQERILFVLGVETPTAAMPNAGEARYNGRFRADAYRAGDLDNDKRQRYSGIMRLVANFDLSELSGAVNNVLGSQPGSNDRQPLPTSSFTISDGAIQNGHFTATLTGVDTDPTVAFTDSVRGFMGRIRGQFFGPAGDELGGAVTAARDVVGEDDDLNLYGFVLAEAERNIALDGSAQISTLVTGIL